jgi:hypothetical protein
MLKALIICGAVMVPLMARDEILLAYARCFYFGECAGLSPPPVGVSWGWSDDDGRRT